MRDVSEQTGPGAATAKRVSRKVGVLGCFAAAAATGVLLLIGLTIAIAIFAKPFIERRIVERARERGLDVRIGHFELGWTHVTLGDVEASLVGVRGIHAEIDSVEVTLERLEPVSVVAREVDLQLEGSAPSIALDLAEWARAYPGGSPQAYRGSLAAHGVRVEWRETADDEPWLRLSGGTIVPTAEGGTLQADRATVAGVELGRVGAGWTATETVIDLGFGAEKLEQAPVRIAVRHADSPPTARFTLNPTPLHRLSEPLGALLPVDEDVKLSGEVELVLPPAFQRGKIDGRVSLVLEGYIPPHPVELSGFVFGDSTTIDTQIAISEDRSIIELEQTRLTAGRFSLQGRGKVERFQSHARVQVALRGDLPCSALANAAAQSRLGQSLGKIVGSAASMLVKGSVAVLVKVDADTRRLSEAKVLRTIGVGCGLKPIPIPGIGTIDLGDITLDDLSKLPSSISTSLPPLPSALPPLSVPKGFPFPSLAAPPEGHLAGEPEEP